MLHRLCCLGYVVLSECHHTVCTREDVITSSLICTNSAISLLYCTNKSARNIFNRHYFVPTGFNWCKKKSTFLEKKKGD